MERLTFTDEELAEFEDMDCPVKNNDLVNRFCDSVCDEFQYNCPFKELGKKLKAYEDKQEQGLLIDVPVKPEDTVYIIVKKDISPQKVIEIHISCNGIEITTNRRAFHISDFGKTVFLTETEAEEALARMKGE